MFLVSAFEIFVNSHSHTNNISKLHLVKSILVNFIFMSSINYNHGDNIMSIFYVLPNFPFTTSETKPDY